MMPQKLLIEIIRKSAVSFMTTALFAILAVILLIASKNYTDAAAIGGYVFAGIACITGIFHFLQVHISEHYLRIIQTQDSVMTSMKKTSVVTEKANQTAVQQQYSPVSSGTDDSIKAD